jgi:predicted O-methyltransferase YrrM
MDTREAFARELLELRTGPGPYEGERAADRRLAAALVRLARAAYILELGGGDGAIALGIARTLGHTGRVEMVEPRAELARVAEARAREAGLSDRVRVNIAAYGEVVPALSGPYDMVLAWCEPADLAPIYDDLVRLTRIGGSVIVPHVRDIEAARPFLTRLASDVRIDAAFPETLEPVLAVRAR